MYGCGRLLPKLIRRLASDARSQQDRPRPPPLDVCLDRDEALTDEFGVRWRVKPFGHRQPFRVDHLNDLRDDRPGAFLIDVEITTGGLNIAGVAHRLG